jgi:hypothetical protein
MPEDEVVEASSEEPCETCDDMNKVLAAFSLTTACQYVEDDEKKRECIDWAESIDPETIDNFMNVAKDLVRRAGIDAINLMTTTTNDVLHSAMIEVIKEQKDAGMPIPEAHDRIYKALTLRRGL